MAATTNAFTELLGETLVSAAGQVATSEALAGKEAVALYFSAHWCPPCRAFTPKLAEWYQASLQAKGLEIVFVSSDQDEGQFKEYFEGMPWLALPFEARTLKGSLSDKYGIQGIPSLVILDAAGNTITAEGRAAVSADPTGESFPWKDGGSGAGQGAAVKRATTKQLMEKEAVQGPCTAFCTVGCCFWIPMLFFMGAANTLTTCESDHFALWLKIYGTLPLASLVVMHLIATFWACRRSGTHFKNALRIQGVTSLIMLTMLIWGWVEYAKTSEVMCVGGEDINPRTLALVYLILGSVFSCCSSCVAVQQIRNPTGAAAAASGTEGGDLEAGKPGSTEVSI